VAERPTITTLIPTYRRPRLLARAIKSALNQTYPHLQVCVYDNASGDDTRETVQRLSEADQRVKYICRPTNIGLQQNFIQAMERVNTPFFSFLSDDDMLLPEFYETALAGFDKHPEAMMSATVTLRIDQAGEIVRAPLLKWRQGLYLPPEGFLAMLDDVHPDWTSVLFRQDVVDKVGVLDEETGAPSDFDYMLRVAAKFPMVVSNRPGAFFSLHSGGYSATPGVYASSGCLKMIENQTKDESVSLQVRTHARMVLTKRLIRRLIEEQSWNASRKAAHTLGRDHGLWFKSFLFIAESWARENFPFAQRALGIAYAFRESRIRHGLLPLQKQFGSLAKKRLKDS
jgi:glycosyltransferase involved in cell wall biosynthesis